MFCAGPGTARAGARPRITRVSPGSTGIAVHENGRYVKLENPSLTPTLATSPCSYPQVAQSTVEMLTIQFPQSADFSSAGALARPLQTP